MDTFYNRKGGFFKWGGKKIPVRKKGGTQKNSN